MASSSNSHSDMFALADFNNYPNAAQVEACRVDRPATRKALVELGRTCLSIIEPDSAGMVAPEVAAQGFYNIMMPSEKCNTIDDWLNYYVDNRSTFMRCLANKMCVELRYGFKPEHIAMHRSKFARASATVRSVVLSLSFINVKNSKKEFSVNTEHVYNYALGGLLTLTTVEQWVELITLWFDLHAPFVADSYSEYIQSFGF